MITQPQASRDKLGARKVLSPWRGSDWGGMQWGLWQRRAPKALLGLASPSLAIPIYTLLGEQSDLTAAKKQIILPAMAVFTQKPVVYEEQLSQSTQRNTLQYFLKRVLLLH